MNQKQYCIMIKARGPHHEGHGTGNRHKDADNMLTEFLERLRSLGHEVAVASFAYEGKTEMLVGSPRDLNNLDDLYGISAAGGDEEPTEEDRLERIDENVRALLEEFRGFVAYEIAEDADDPKTKKKGGSKTRPSRKMEPAGPPPAEKNEEAAQETAPQPTASAEPQTQSTEETPPPEA
jgi:hypothetical protein